MPVGMGRAQQAGGGRDALQSWGTGPNVPPGAMAPGTLLSPLPSPLCVGRPREEAGREQGAGAMALACSQQKAESGLLNFSRWRIKQAVADVPRQGELAGLKLSAPACPWQPVPSPREMPSAVASDAGTGCGWGSLPRYVSCRLNSSPWPSGEGKEAQEGAGQGAGGCRRSPGGHSAAWDPCATVTEMGLESRQGAGGQRRVADRGS